MIASHIHDALGQVDRMRSLILERRRFRGFSGSARILGGVAALAAAGLLDRLEPLRSPQGQLIGWGIVLAAALVLNFGGLLFRFLRNPRAVPADLRPALEVIPALAAGAALSVALVMRGQYDLLFGSWMALYGLAHMGYRHSLPPGILVVGLFYQAAGIACLLAPGISILNPWPMGLIFFAGESVGGWLLLDPVGSGPEPHSMNEEQQP